MTKKDYTKNPLVMKLAMCVEQILELHNSKGIPEEGLTLYVAGIECKNKNYDMTIALTPEGVFDEFKKNK